MPRTSIRDFKTPFLDLKVSSPAEARIEMIKNNPKMGFDEADRLITLNYLGMLIEVQVTALNSLTDIHLSLVAMMNKVLIKQKENQKILKAIYRKLKNAK